MRALVVSIWVFINLVFFGMCGYMYLLWSQYWMFMDKQAGATTSTYDQQIYYYNRGYLPDLNKTHNLTETKIRTKHSIRDNVTLIKNSKPRFPNLQGSDFELDTKKFICFANDTKRDCLEKTEEFKDKILKEFQRVLNEEGNVFKIEASNAYNVHYSGTKRHFQDKSQKEIMCELKKIKILTLKSGDVSGGPSNVGNYLPKKQLYEKRKFNSCAIVASSGALKGSKLGRRIDSHDLVLRFNNAPTAGFEEDVGRKTTIRLLNSQVVTRQEFQFLDSHIYKNVTIVAWDPSNYTSTLEDWLQKPEFNLFPVYVQYKKKNARPKFFLINPRSLWELWDFLQSNSLSRLRKNPVSSGFLALGLLLPICNLVDMYEYIPSSRATKRCHYYHSEENAACTFGVWHPLAAEKLLTYHLNTLDDGKVFQDGFIRLPEELQMDVNYNYDCRCGRF